MSDIDLQVRYELDAEGIVRELARIGCVGRVTATGRADYQRCFIIAPDGCSVGRITIFEGKYHHTKWYFREYGDLVGTDKLITQWEYVLATGRVLSDEDWGHLVFMARSAQVDDYEAKKQWREDNPSNVNEYGKKSRRRALQIKNIRVFIRQLVYVAFEGEK